MLRIIQTYTDSCGNTASVSQMITIEDTTPPVFAIPPADVTVEHAVDVPAMTDLGWMDNCDGSGIVTGVDSSNGLSFHETITRTWTYSDACCDTVSVNQTITIENATSKIEEEDEDDQSKQTILFPNPNTGIFTLYFLGPLQEETTISIVSLQGKLVYSDTLHSYEKVKEFNLTHIESGLYTLTIIDTEIILRQIIVKI